MSAEANIKTAYERAGAKVLTLKRMGNAYRVEVEVCGKRKKFFAEDPAKANWKNKKLFEKSLRDIQRFEENVLDVPG